MNGNRKGVYSGSVPPSIGVNSRFFVAGKKLLIFCILKFMPLNKFPSKIVSKKEILTLMADYEMHVEPLFSSFLQICGAKNGVELF